MSPAVHGGGPRWKFFEYNTLLSVESFREERIMDANRYFTAMHNAMSSRLPGAQLLAAVRLQDLCGNDAYLEVRRMPGEPCATVCYSTMGRRGLNFQLFRKGWMLCHNESGQLTGQFPAKAESLLEDTDFHACCREDRLDAARTDRMVQELEYMMRISDEKEEERFKALDETLRAHQKDNQGKAEAAAARMPFFRKKRFGRSGKKL